MTALGIGAGTLIGTEKGEGSAELVWGAGALATFGAASAHFGLKTASEPAMALGALGMIGAGAAAALLAG